MYTVGVTTVMGGVYAPVAMLLVVIMLHFFRAIYTEVGTAIPFNGKILFNCSNSFSFNFILKIN